MRLLCYFAAALCLLLCCQIGSRAQPAASPGAALEAPGDAAANGVQPRADVEQVRPDTYMLPDEQGILRPLLGGWTFEDFMRVWKSQQDSRHVTEEPAYSLERLSLRGQVEGDNFIRLAVQVEVRLQDDRRLRIPLGFPDGVLDGYELSPRDDDSYVRYDEDLGEHVLWIAGKSNETREVELQLLLPVVRRGAEAVLKFHPPRAAVSQLALDVAGAEIVVESLNPSTRVTTTPQDGQTHITASGLAKTTEIAWRTLQGADREPTRSLVAQSDVRILAEQSLVRMNVSLNVRSLRGEVDRFRFRLPPHFRLVSEDLEAGTLQRIDEAETARAARPQPGTVQSQEPGAPDGAGRTSLGPTYEVRVAQPQQLPLAVQLVLERPLSLSGEGTELIVSGVEVLGAVGQQGIATLTVSEDLQVRWEEGLRIRQIATPREQTSAVDVTATFEFDAAGWRLPIVLAARRTEVSVVPDYQLEIGRDELLLTATYSYSVRGTMRQALRYALADWELARDPMGPESTIRGTSAFIDNAAGTMYLPLANPAEGSFETTLRLHMPRPASSDVMQIRLPECLVDGTVQEGRLSVRADPSLEVIPQIQSSRGLSPRPGTRQDREPGARQPSSTATSLEPSEDAVQEFHVTSLPAEYVAHVRPRTQSIVHKSRVTAQLYPDHVFVDQEIELDVRHLPTNHLVLRAPAALAANPSAAYSLDGQSVAPPWEGDSMESGVSDRHIAQIVLEQPQLGPTVLQIQYRIPIDREESGTTSARQVVGLPIAVPEADSHQFDVTLSNHTSDLQAQFRAPNVVGSDSVDDGPPPAAPDVGSRLEFSAPAYLLPLIIEPAASMSQRTLVVDRMWIQSRVAGRRMQTRTAMQLVPATDQIVLDLGDDASVEVSSIEVNNRPVYALAGAKEVELSIGELEQDAPCVITIVQHGSFSPEVEGNLRVVPPRVVNARGYTNVFWQIVLPQSLHAFCTSEGLLSESPWRLQGAYWSRIPTMSQDDLEAWIGVPHETGPPASSNQLLMAGLDLPRVLDATLVRRSSIVLLASGSLLAAAILVLYVRRLQRWEWMVAATAALAVAGLLYPDIAPLIAQAGALGAALVLIAVFLRVLTGRRQSTMPVRGPADTSIFPRETAPKESTPIPVAYAETPSSAKTLVHGLTDSGAQHSA